MTSDNARWLGLVGMAGLISLLAVYWIGALAMANRAIPDALGVVAAAAVAAFFTNFGTMIGARSSQNGTAQGVAAAQGTTPPASSATPTPTPPTVATGAPGLGPTGGTGGF